MKNGFFLFFLILFGQVDIGQKVCPLECGKHEITASVVFSRTEDLLFASIELNAEADECSYSFSLGYDSRKMIFLDYLPSSSLGDRNGAILEVAGCGDRISIKHSRFGHFYDGQNQRQQLGAFKFRILNPNQETTAEFAVEKMRVWVNFRPPLAPVDLTVCWPKRILLRILRIKWK